MYDHSQGLKGFRTGNETIIDTVNSLHCLVLGEPLQGEI